MMARIPDTWFRVLARFNLEPACAQVALELASMPRGLEASPRRHLALAALFLLAVQAQGSTRLDLNGPDLELLKRLFEAQDLDLPSLLADPRVAPLVGSGGEIRPLMLEDGLLSTGRLRAAERGLAARIRARAGRGLEPSAGLDEDILVHPVQLSEEQRDAVRRAVNGPLTLITGGPGTGKTSIVRAMLGAFLQRGLEPAEIALTAPTGRAATRMGESLGAAPEVGGLGARTLHRLLGWDQSRCRFHGRNPLQARLVVVDEASMVSLELMASLMEALRPDATLVLLGDAEQLPSVEAGSAFRDLVEALPECTARLTRSYRMDPQDPGGRAILLAAQALREGRCGEEVLPNLENPGALPSLGAHVMDADREEVAEFLRRWSEELWSGDLAAELQEPLRQGPEGWAPGQEARLTRLFGRFGRRRILCPLRTAPALQGVESINAFLHERWRSLTGKGLAKELAFLPGEPVVMRRNDYRRGIFNGDPGLVLRMSGAGGELHQVVVFAQGESFIAFPISPLLPDLELGYAGTVHRAQGSEFDHVALVLPREDGPLMTREILYTALTRARKSAVILGSREGLERAAERAIHRATGLLAALRSPGT